jgi:hypothetical protein
MTIRINILGSENDKNTADRNTQSETFLNDMSGVGLAKPSDRNLLYIFDMSNSSMGV